MSSKTPKLAPACLTVSFRYLDTTKDKFSLSLGDADFFADVFGRLKAINQITKDQFIALQSTGKNWRLHRIDWNGTEHPVSVPSFGLPAPLAADENAWQFMTSKSTGRVHGFLVSDTFFVVWLDPQHNLYSGKGG